MRVRRPHLHRPAPARLLLVALLGTALLAGCSGGSETPAEPSPVAAPTEEPPPPPEPEPVDPLTGTAPAPGAPMVALKIDNAPLARPFFKGLEAASVVYHELVEGGATRLLVLYSHPPDIEVGPIRSFRESDIDLLRQHGPIAVGFSGANDGVLASFRQAVAAGQLADVSYDTQPGLYRIGERRRDAKNFYAVPARMAEAAAGAAPARDIGWTFDPAPRPDATPGTAATVVFSDRTTVELRYDVASTRYGVFEAGAGLAGASPANVLIMQVPVVGSQYRDVTGAVTPFTGTLGTGPVEVLRDGTRVTGRWERPTAEDGTRLLDAAGAPIALKPGPTWVLLQPAGLPSSVS
jgi:hypothetical protein